MKPSDITNLPFNTIFRSCELKSIGFGMSEDVKRSYLGQLSGVLVLEVMRTFVDIEDMRKNESREHSNN